jgi:hypothetical protein
MLVPFCTTPQRSMRQMNDKDPEHDRFNGRIHQDSSFPGGGEAAVRTSSTAYIIPLDAIIT